MRLHEAFDFGTKQLSIQTKTAWSHVGANMLPPVPVRNWTRPMPVNAVGTGVPAPIGSTPAPPAGWSLVLPKSKLFYRMPADGTRNPGSPYIPAALPALVDCVIDLQLYQEEIHNIL